jgi:hypothetical protein
LIPTCPICGDPAPVHGNPNRPFCSARCRLVDLDRWLSGDYRIPAEAADPTDLAIGESGAPDATAPTERR